MDEAKTSKSTWDSMRLVMFAAALLLILIPVTPIVGVYNAKSPSGTPQTITPSSSGATTTGPPTGLHVIVKSIHGVAFLNFTGSVTIFPATLFLNMTVLSSNSTGVSFSVDSGNVTEGFQGMACPAPTCTYRVWKVDSGTAFFWSIGVLTISATTTETSPAGGGVWLLSLKGPARMIQLTSASQAGYELFALLFGRIYNSTTTIGLLFLVGIGAKLGDVDMDGRIDISDLVAVALSFGTSLGEPNYNPYADVAMHGEVNIQDLSMVAANYGQTY